MELYNVSHNEYYIIDTNNVARRAIRRYTTRIRAKLRRAQIALARSIHQGYEHNNDTINKKLEPVARIDDDCTKITWHPTVMRWIALAGLERKNTKLSDQHTRQNGKLWSERRHAKNTQGIDISCTEQRAAEVSGQDIVDEMHCSISTKDLKNLHQIITSHPDQIAIIY